jgi:hypothetical protein
VGGNTCEDPDREWIICPETPKAARSEKASQLVWVIPCRTERVSVRRDKSLPEGAREQASHAV